MRRALPRPAVALSSLASLALLAQPSPARAEGIRLDWVRGAGAESCVDRVALEDRVRERLGRDPFEAPHGSGVEGTIEREGDAWLVRLRLRSLGAGGEEGEPLGTRELRSRAESCADVTTAIELALALVVEELVPGDDETSVELPWPAPPPPEPAPPRRPMPVLDPDLSRVPPPASRPLRLAGRVAVRGALLSGSLPGPSGAIGLAAGIDVDALAIDLAVEHAPEVALVSGDRRFGFGLTTGSIAAGGTIGIDWLEIGISGGLEVGALHAIAYDRAAPAPGARPTASLFAAVVARAIVADVVLFEIGARPTVALVRHAFELEVTREPVWAQEPVSLAFWAAIGLRLGERRNP